MGHTRHRNETRLENEWFGHRAAAPKLKVLLDELEALEELDGNINEVLDTFGVHYKAGASFDPEVASQLDALGKARDGLKRAEKIAEAVGAILDIYPEDKTATRASKDAEVMIKRFQRNEKKAGAMIRTLSKKLAPKTLLDAASKAARSLRKLLVDPKSLQIVPWQGEEYSTSARMKGVVFMMVLRTHTGEGNFDLTLGQHTADHDGVKIIGGRTGWNPGWKPYDLKKAKEMFLEGMQGKPELKGEGDRNTERLRIAPEIARAMERYAEKEGDTYNRNAEISKDGRKIEVSFRTEYDDRDYGQYEEPDFPDFAPGMVKALSSWSSAIKDVNGQYGEKGWYYVTVTLK
jgi:hypothetical protein